MNLTLKQIAELSKSELKGDENFVPSGICGLDSIREGAISYSNNIDKPETFKDLKLGALILPKSAKDKEIPFGGNIIYADNPEWAFTLAMREVSPLNKDVKPGIHERAVVSPSAKIGQNVFIGANTVVEDDAVIGDNTIIYPNVYIGKKVQIGQGCLIYPNVTIREECVLKNKVILQPGCVIGSDGFGYVFNGKHEKIPQLGNVILEDDVEIGANTTIDRAKINHTIIGANTKIDNLVQIGHNVKTGMSCIIVSQVGIAGSTELGNGVILAGQAGVSGHLKLGDGVVVGPQTGIISNIKAGEKIMGSPSMPYGDFMRLNVIFKKLPELYKEITNLKKKFKLF